MFTKIVRCAVLLPLVILTLILCQELAVRFVLHEYNPANHVKFLSPTPSQPALGIPNKTFLHTRNTRDFSVLVSFNKYGYRDSKDLANSTSNDVFLIGDSYAMGWGVELSESLFERLSVYSGCRVFNISTIGRLPDFEKSIAYARSKGAQVERVVLLLNTELSVRRYAKQDNAVRKAAPKPVVPRVWLGRMKQFLLDHSALYFALTSVIHRTPALRRIAVQFGLIVPTEHGIKTPDLDVEAVEATVARIKQLDGQVVLTVVVMPSRALFQPATADRAIIAHRALVREMNDAQIRTVDLLPVMRDSGDPSRFYFEVDPHFSAFGYDISARQVASAGDLCVAKTN